MVDFDEVVVWLCVWVLVEVWDMRMGKTYI